MGKQVQETVEDNNNDRHEETCYDPGSVGTTHDSLHSVVLATSGRLYRLKLRIAPNGMSG